MIAPVVRTDFGIWGCQEIGERWGMGHVSGAEGNGVDSAMGSIGGQIMNHCTCGARSFAHV